MEYCWKEIPDMYFTLNNGTLIGANLKLKSFNESYTNNFREPWFLKVEEVVSDFDLIDTLLDIPFDIYTCTIVNKYSSGESIEIWHKYSSAEISEMDRTVESDGIQASFFEVFMARNREQVNSKDLPEDIINFLSKKN